MGMIRPKGIEDPSIPVPDVQREEEGVAGGGSLEGWRLVSTDATDSGFAVSIDRYVERESRD